MADFAGRQRRDSANKRVCVDSETRWDSGKRLYGAGVRPENLKYDLPRSALDYKDGIFYPYTRYFAISQD
jgi:hypothetical protein